MEPQNLENYTVKDILTQFVLPELKEMRAESSKQQDELNTRIARLEAWRNKGIGALALVTMVLIPVAIPVAIQVLTTFGHH